MSRDRMRLARRSRRRPARALGTSISWAFPGVLAGVLAGLLVWGGPDWTLREARGADAPPAAAPGDPGGDALPRAGVVVLGRVRVLVPPRGMGGTTVVRVATEKVLRGHAEPTFTVFVGGGRNTDHATRPTVPWFAADTTGRFALFLEPSPHGSGLGLVAAFRADDAAGKEKAEVLEGELAIAALPDPALRDRRWTSYLLDLAGGERPWSQRYALAALERFVAEDRGRLDPATRAELEAIVLRTFDAGLRDRIGRLLRGTPAPSGEPRAPDDDLPAPLAGSLPPAYHRMLRELATTSDPEARLVAVSELARLGRSAAGPDLLRIATTDPSAAMRERAAVLLGDVGDRAAATPLRARFEDEAEAGVREAIVRAIGTLGDDGDVTWLVARAESPPLRRAVAFALARIRTVAARAALDGLVAPREGVVPPEALLRLVEYLRSEAFVDAESLAGRSVGPRPRRATPADGGSAPSREDEAPSPDGSPTPVTPTTPVHPR